MCPIKIELVLQINLYFVDSLTRYRVSFSSQDPIVGPETKLVESQQNGCCQGDVCLTEPICSCPCARGACLFWIWRVHWHAHSVEHKVNLCSGEKKEKEKKTWHVWNHVTSQSGLRVTRVYHALQWVTAGDLSVSICLYTCCWDEWYWFFCIHRRNLSCSISLFGARREKKKEKKRGKAKQNQQKKIFEKIKVWRSAAHVMRCCCTCVCERERKGPSVPALLWWKQKNAYEYILPQMITMSAVSFSLMVDLLKYCTEVHFGGTWTLFEYFHLILLYTSSPLHSH